MKTACIDFDGVLVPWGDLMGPKDVLPGAKETLEELRAAGYRIVIFTSRLSPNWLASEVEKGKTPSASWVDEAIRQAEYVEGILDAADIPYDGVTAEKVKADFYLDDNAIRFVDWKTSAAAIKGLGLL